MYFSIVFAIPLVAVTVSTYLKVNCHHVIGVTSLFQGHVIFRICTLTGSKERQARNLQRETQIKYNYKNIIMQSPGKF